MTTSTDRQRRAAIRAQYAAEEAEAAEAEALEDATEAAQTVLSVRVPAVLDEALKNLATAQHTSTSALVRRILTQAVHRHALAPGLTPEQAQQVEEIARRVMHEAGQD